MAGSAMDVARWEALRRRFRPSQIAVLLVGESPPKGDTFFYDGNSNLFWHTWKAFTMAIPSVPNVGDFLNWFKAMGWYLTDLSPAPINNLSKTKRRELRVDGEPGLARFITESRPPVVIAVMLAIEENVRRAITQANYTPEAHYLPFPAHGHQGEFERGLATIVRDLMKRTIR